ncbi:hypothetical protein P9112_005904 [Eukaryota sp. TZLM1-RC]
MHLCSFLLILAVNLFPVIADTTYFIWKSDDFGNVASTVTFLQSWKTSPAELVFIDLSPQQQLNTSLFTVSAKKIFAVFIHGLLLEKNTFNYLQAHHIPIFLLQYAPPFTYDSYYNFLPLVFSLRPPPPLLIETALSILSSTFTNIAVAESEIYHFPEVMNFILKVMDKTNVSLQLYKKNEFFKPTGLPPNTLLFTLGNVAFVDRVLNEAIDLLPSAYLVPFPCLPSFGSQAVNTVFLDVPELHYESSSCFDSLPAEVSESPVNIELLDIYCCFSKSINSLSALTPTPTLTPIRGFAGDFIITNGTSSLHPNIVVNKVPLSLRTAANKRHICVALIGLITLFIFVFLKKFTNILGQARIKKKHRAIVMTDIMSSSYLWEKLRSKKGEHTMKTTVLLHNQLIREMVNKYNGFVFYNEGDGFLLLFNTVNEAVEFCTDVQYNLVHKVNWPSELLEETLCTESYHGDSLIWRGLRVRMGVHYGLVDYSVTASSFMGSLLTRYTRSRRSRSGYLGGQISVCGAVTNASHGGQILLSRSAFRQLEKEGFPVLTKCVALGVYRLDPAISVQALYQCEHLDLIGRKFPPVRARTTTPTRTRSEPFISFSPPFSPKKRFQERRFSDFSAVSRGIGGEEFVCAK